MSEKTILNIGCGDAPIAGAVNLDIDPESKADLLHDLDVMPWPFADDSFDRIICSHIVEHVRNPFLFLKEIHRVSRHGAILELATPHYSSPDSWNDLTHYGHFGLKAFEPFYTSRHLIHSRSTSMELVSRKLTFGRGLPSLGGRFLAALLSPTVYEKYFCHLFPARNMEFQFRVVKQVGD